MKVLAAIPARLGSKRLPNKPLLNATGMPLVVHTARNVARANLLNDVYVVTDSSLIFEQCFDYGVKATVFDFDAWCGTVRIAEAVRRGLVDAEVILNVQCDEPCVPPSALDELITLVEAADDRTIGTIVGPLTSVGQWADENLVKADCDYGGWCHHFARSGWFTRAHGHVGVYGFKRQTLLAAAELPQSDASKVWSLEQLSWICHDKNHTSPVNCVDNAPFKIRAVFAPELPLSVNTAEDYQLFVQYWLQHQGVPA